MFKPATLIVLLACASAALGAACSSYTSETSCTFTSSDNCGWCCQSRVCIPLTSTCPNNDEYMSEYTGFTCAAYDSASQAVGLVGAALIAAIVVPIVVCVLCIVLIVVLVVLSSRRKRAAQGAVIQQA